MCKYLVTSQEKKIRKEERKKMIKNEKLKKIKKQKTKKIFSSFLPADLLILFRICTVKKNKLKLKKNKQKLQKKKITKKIKKEKITKKDKKKNILRSAGTSLVSLSCHGWVNWYMGNAASPTGLSLILLLPNKFYLAVGMRTASITDRRLVPDSEGGFNSLCRYSLQANSYTANSYTANCYTTPKDITYIYFVSPKDVTYIYFTSPNDATSIFFTSPNEPS